MRGGAAGSLRRVALRTCYEDVDACLCSQQHSGGHGGGAVQLQPHHVRQVPAGGGAARRGGALALAGGRCWRRQGGAAAAAQQAAAPGASRPPPPGCHSPPSGCRSRLPARHLAHRLPPPGDVLQLLRVEADAALAPDDGDGRGHGAVLPHHCLHLLRRGQVLGVGHACGAQARGARGVRRQELQRGGRPQREAWQPRRLSRGAGPVGGRAGGHSPWLMIVLSSATTAWPDARARCTSGRTLSCSEAAEAACGGATGAAGRGLPWRVAPLPAGQQAEQSAGQGEAFIGSVVAFGLLGSSGATLHVPPTHLLRQAGRALSICHAQVPRQAF
jgi:hypothetical protein